jgi:hypothetical protein
LRVTSNNNNNNNNNNNIKLCKIDLQTQAQNTWNDAVNSDDSQHYEYVTVLWAGEIGTAYER